MSCLYETYDIESFEAGKGSWHARIRRADLKPVLIDGALFPKLEVGDAKKHIDRCQHRWRGGGKVRAVGSR